MDRCSTRRRVGRDRDEIEAAVARGDAGILITPSGDAVVPAIEAAREAGLYVIALDTPPNPADSVDITFATDNYLAGQLIGQWTAAQLDGESAVIAMRSRPRSPGVTPGS